MNVLNSFTAAGDFSRHENHIDRRNSAVKELILPLTKGHLSNEDRIIWQQVLSMSLILPLTKGHLSHKGRIIWQQVLWMSLILPLTKGHLSNEDRSIWQKGCPY